MDDLLEELQLFIEDMDDQLSIMESTLLDISELPLEEIDNEMINNLFRAMHTMKGNAGIFGFDLIIDFAHKAENLLDIIRNDELSLSKELIELFLLIKDHSKLLVENSTGNLELNPEQQQEHQYLLEEISKHLNQVKNKENLVEKEECTVLEDENSLLDEYTIEVKLKNEFFVSGMDMISIIKYLSIIGEVLDLKLITDDVPSFEVLKPKEAYIEFLIIYSTDEPISEIEEAFEFVKEDIILKIEKKQVLVKNTIISPPIVEEVETIENTEPQADFQIFKKPTKKLIKEEKKIPVVIPKELNMSLRVDSSKIDILINQISEMVIANAKITQYAVNTKDSDFEEAVVVMSEMLEEIRDGVMNIRMMQVGESFAKFRRTVSDVSKKLNKEISFEIEGGETELDKTVIEKMSDPLMHMLRNSIDHGIETKDVRLEHNKDPIGKITLKAFPDSGTIVIEVSDDGAGIATDTLYEKAIEKNIIEPYAKLSDKEILDLIFHPGFSTAQEVSNISGRGVGMDVVKRNITDLRGTISVESVLGKGTTISIRLPLTLAIIDGFLVKVGEYRYIVPLDNIKECIEFTDTLKKQYDEHGYITLRKEILPILDIAEHFSIEDVEVKRKNIVVVKYGNSTVGLKVDSLFGEFQTVIKPLGELFKNVPDISGGTILGNGEIALIFDVQKLIEHKMA